MHRLAPVPREQGAGAAGRPRWRAVAFAELRLQAPGCAPTGARGRRRAPLCRRQRAHRSPRAYVPRAPQRACATARYPRPTEPASARHGALEARFARHRAAGRPATPSSPPPPWRSVAEIAVPLSSPRHTPRAHVRKSI